jgi:nucleotide-binding universal stress UspA family protein
VPAPSWDLQPAAQEQAQSAVDALSAARPDLVRQIEIEPLGVCGRPTDELVERSRGADLLVVGHRGRGAVASALLGSVGLGCVLRARCPVTIVRPGANTTPAVSAAATSAPAAV